MQHTSETSTVCSAAATIIVLLLGTVYFFYDYTLKEYIDSYLTDVFRRSTYEADEKAGRKVYRSDVGGFAGMMEEMNILFLFRRDGCVLQKTRHQSR
mmetsp:Transcript_4107/g.7645  ORF Transcript_4107/g.7645 Transcript_4107/m.7645 type:complete len:97 (+) Transcript_4107:43-333(+)